ncbi:uncharacterized protein LOC116766774 isoform X3 [Danaus plexippus]|uniref:uncharacterized protein LOC116766774 isoform X3 n=1 Tax=Danaus plexippus TaxID=13037 RepID=UPI002AB28722|nr:uncharacterized protein LOC116766774 isoform X3 [Danaus plexippus]
MMKLSLRLAVLTIGFVTVIAAPVADNGHENGDLQADVPVKELENLKMEESSKEVDPGIQNREHVEIHRLGAVQQNGELVSRVEQHASADSVGDEKPKVHAQTQLDVPAEGVHKMIIQDGTHVSVLEGTVHTTPATEEQTTKIFHGAARLVQTGAAANTPTNGHTAVRRAFNDVTKEFKKNMTKEDAIAFLQEIKFNIDYLRAHYTQNLKAAEENAQQEKLRNFIMEQNAKEYQYRPTPLQFPFGSSPEVFRTLPGKTWDVNNLGVIPSMQVSNDLRPEPVKRTYDPMLQTNVISTSDYDRDGQIISEEEYEEMMDKLRAADSLYTEYTLEEIIYQLAKMMFSQSLYRSPSSARAATQRFMTFLELEAERGQLSRTIEKKVLDVMMAALTDTIGDHPELLQARDGLGIAPANRIMNQFLETSASEPSMSRAILAAYKDELLKGPPLHKLGFTDRN